MIDIHIIPAPGNEANYALQLERLKHPLVNTIIGEYVAGNILEARYRAFSQGTSPYVSWVDDDDKILDLSWLPKALETLEDPGVAAVYPRWRSTLFGRVFDETSCEAFTPVRYLFQTASFSPHHLTIMRRENVMECLNRLRERHPTTLSIQERYLVISQLRYGRIVKDDTLAYEWVLRQGTGRQMLDTTAVREFMRIETLESLEHFKP